MIRFRAFMERRTYFSKVVKMEEMQRLLQKAQRNLAKPGNGQEGEEGQNRMWILQKNFVC